MIELDDALRAHVADWGRDEAGPPDLDAALIRARTSQRRRGPTVLAAAACVLVVAAAAVLLGLRSARHVPVASPPLTRSPTRSAPSPSAAVLANLRFIAREVADKNGDDGSITAEAVAQGGKKWFVQLRGNFVCTSCNVPLGTALTGHFITVHVRGYHSYYEGSFGSTVRDLSRLGAVVQLGTIAAETVHNQLAEIAARTGDQNGDSDVSAQAVLTTHGKAEQATSGDTDNLPDRPVWLIQLRGQFVCGACRIPLGAKNPTGRFITLILDATSPYATNDFSLGNQETDLAKLGRVVTLLR